MATSDRLQAPDGYILFGWWVSPGGIQTQIRESVVHLMPAGDLKARTAVCGREPKARGANLERPADYNPDYHDRRVCVRCFALVLQRTTHRLAGRRLRHGGRGISN